MAEHGGAISHSDDDSSDNHSPRSFPIPSAVTGAGTSGSSRKPPPATPPPTGYTISIAEQHHQILTPTTTKKPRGRPPGSKNKPKPPLVINQDNELALKPVVIEVAAGSDVVEALVTFARRRQVGISVLSGSGSISNVTLRHPISHAPSYTLHGPFTLVSLSGTYIADVTLSSSPPSSAVISNWPPPCSSSFGICLSGSQGQVFGGVVGGKVVAATVVVVVATVFKRPEFHRVNMNAEGEGGNKNDNNNNNPSSAAGGGGGGGGQGGNEFNGANTTPLNIQVPADMNVLQWPHSGGTRPHTNF